MNNAVVKKN